MRVAWIAAFGLALCVGEQAYAGTTVKVRTEFYDITGDSGEALLRSMDSRGPRQGFLTRAVAQTRYSVSWELAWQKSGKSCRLQNAVVKLDMTYKYPRATAKMSASLKSRWSRFMTNVRGHEETHGRMAREMATAAHRAIAGYSNNADPTCSKSVREVNRRVEQVMALYEKRQLAFDASEHRPGGHVSKVVRALLGPHAKA